METNLVELLSEHLDWRLTLQAYQAAEAVVAEQMAQERVAAKKSGSAAPSAEVVAEGPSSADHEEAGEEGQRKQAWVRRLPSVEGIPVERLAPIHGRLIAEGLLQFSLGSRDEGVLYRLSRDAKQTLSTLPEISAVATSIETEADEPAPVPQAA